MPSAYSVDTSANPAFYLSSLEPYKPTIKKPIFASLSKTPTPGGQHLRRSVSFSKCGNIHCLCYGIQLLMELSGTVKLGKRKGRSTLHSSDSESESDSDSPPALGRLSPPSGEEQGPRRSKRTKITKQEKPAVVSSSTTTSMRTRRSLRTYTPPTPPRTPHSSSTSISPTRKRTLSLPASSSWPSAPSRRAQPPKNPVQPRPSAGKPKPLTARGIKKAPISAPATIPWKHIQDHISGKLTSFLDFAEVLRENDPEEWGNPFQAGKVDEVIELFNRASGLL
jgi:hypothetical protein